MTLADITLDRWIEFTNSCMELDAWLECAKAQPESKRKQVLLTNNYVERAFAWAKFFGIESDIVDDLVNDYETFLDSFNNPTSVIQLPALDDIVYGQFHDSKMIIGGTLDKSRWEQLKYIIVIYASETFNPKDCNEESIAFKAVGNMEMDKCIYVLNWFDQLNETIQANFTIFHESEETEQPNMKAHMQRWGWVNFLKTIAKTKVFDIAGSNMNSIDCVRSSSLEDVLTWASEEKDCNIASMRDMELLTQK